jgi:UDP-3-O-[3-hydroxymyristoyl] glucosamine N-acyltransferase
MNRIIDNEFLKKFKLKVPKDFSKIEDFKIGNLDFHDKKSLCWLKNIDKYESFNKCNLIIHDNDYRLLIENDKLNIDINHLISNDNPRLIFAKILKEYFEEEGLIYNNVVNSHAKNNKIFIGENVYIGENVLIGDNTKVYNNTVIHNNTVIGKNCIIKENVTIGSEGLGFVKEADSWIKFPQIGSVLIEDNVEIGTYCDIKRGALGKTIIAESSILGSYNNIGHNCKIGKNSLITAKCTLGGSTVTGSNFWMGMNSTTKNGVNIGNNVSLGSNTYLTKNTFNNEIFIGIPARKIGLND